jgi:hypothetical protein
MRKIVLAAATGLIVLVIGVPAATARFTNPYLLRLVGVEERLA